MRKQKTTSLNNSSTTENIHLIDRIVTRIKNIEITLDNISSEDDDISELSHMLGDVTALQTVIWALIFAQDIEDRKPTIVDIGDLLLMKPIEALTLIPEVENLRSKKLIRILDPRGRKNRTKFCFSVPASVMDRIVYNIEINDLIDSERDVISFLSIVQSCFEEVEFGTMNFDDLLTRIDDLTEEYKDIDYIKNMALLDHLTKEERLLVIRLSIYTMYGRIAILKEVIEEVSLNEQLRIRMKNGIVSGTSILIKDKIVKLESKSFRGEARFSLTDEFVNKQFGKDAKTFISKSNDESGLISPEQIPDVTLFFNDSFQEKIDVVHELLADDAFARIQTELSDDKRTRGITILFYGPPGTGKTESVYQIARKTGRSIFPVQVTDFKGRYFGDSEKNLKEVFVNYEALVKNSAKAPIMLLNEADSILSSRVIVSRSIDQTVNSLQNLLLEYFEINKGIIICTLNDAQNLDKAYSRRILMKLLFEKSDMDTTIRMWKNKLPSLSGDQAGQLTRNHDLSGGEMDNVARKVLILKLVYQRSASFEEIETLCYEEKLIENPFGKLGFSVQG